MPTSANCPKNPSSVRADVGIRAPILPLSQQPLARIGRRMEALEFCGRVCAVLRFLRDESRAPFADGARTSVALKAAPRAATLVGAANTHDTHLDTALLLSAVWAIRACTASSDE